MLFRSFNGCKKDGDATVYKAGDTFAMPGANVTLKADWTPVAAPTYTLTYDGNGSDGGAVPVDANSPYTEGANVTVLGNTGGLTKAGFTFNGWKKDGDATLYKAGDTFTMPGANVTLKADWTPAAPAPTYTVTYDGNGSDSGAVPVDANSPYTEGATVTVLDNTGGLTKAGFTFNS